MDYHNKIHLKKFGLMVILLLISTMLHQSLFAQTKKFTLEGRVTDKISNEPLTLVNVYLSETTLGSATDSKGIFRISEVPQSIFTLVASAIGYEPSIITVDLRKGINKFIELKLSPKAYELNEISVRDKIDEEWKEQFEFFKKLILGDNEFAKECNIINQYHINFREENFIFVAESPLPFTIINNALGYEIECVLKNFEYDKRKQKLTYSILPKFSEVVTSDQDSINYFVNNRKKAYLGSSIHLLSSLAAGRFKYRDEGFTITMDSRSVGKSEEIIYYDDVNNRYYLKFSGCINIEYWNNGVRTNSKICLKFGTAEFSPDGYLMYPNEFEITGAMAKEGVATQLPRFLEISSKEN